MLLEIVDEAVSRLEEQERQHRERERALAALRPEMLLFDASPEGEWVRREQGKATRSILRIIERFRKARRRGETLSPDPPKPPRLEPTPLRADGDASPGRPAGTDGGLRTRGRAGRAGSPRC